jgi:Glycosyltransferase like family 2
LPIDSHLNYLQKHAFCLPQIAVAPSAHLGIVVVIPCHDEPDLLPTLDSLAACMPPACAVEVIVVVSSSLVDASNVQAQNIATLAQVQAWALAHINPHLQVHCLHFPALPPKHAGVGLTRKIGMDEAVHRFALADNPRGIIVSLDADAECDGNYLRALEQYFEAHRKRDSCSLAFEFRAAADADALATEAIACIELAERMLVAGLRKCGHPYAFHTLGAAMAVRVGAYQAQAGMNRRKTGEDFDFLQKFIELGVHGSCADAVVYPSGRISLRKPNGIGQRVAQFCAAPEAPFLVFALESFQALALGLRDVQSWYVSDAAGLEAACAQFPTGFKEFMEAHAFHKTVSEIQRYTSSALAFEKRFYRWFNSLKTFQYFGYCRDHHFPNQPILQVGNELWGWMEGEEFAIEKRPLSAMLAAYRQRLGA